MDATRASTLDRTFHVNAPAVVSEIIDGEAVIMNLRSGNYYSTEQVGSLIWGWIEEGRTYRQLLDRLGAMFGLVPQALAKDVDPFIDSLLAHELVTESEADGAPAPDERRAAALANGARIFHAPVLNAYTDMKDLLLLDPIHDVDEVGWPTPKPTEAP